MATLWIREYTRSSALPIPVEPGIDQTVTFTTTTQSAAFGAQSAMATIIGSAAFHYVVGSSPTATTSNLKWPADTPLTIGITSGDKIAVVAAS